VVATFCYSQKGVGILPKESMFGEALRLIRVYNDLKQTEMADRFHISKSYLSEIESGKKMPPIELLKKYSEEFSLPISSIMFFAEEIPNAKIGEKIRVKIAKNILGMLSFIEKKADNEEQHLRL